MRKGYLLIAVIGTALISVAWQKNDLSLTIGKYQHRLNSGGASAGRTGAPGEQNCTVCHFGSPINGSSENVITVKEDGVAVNAYEAGKVYEISLQMITNPPKKGFQMTVLDLNNAMAGNFASINNGVNISSGAAGKKYANHSFAGSNGGTWPIWTFNWTAPATDQGPVRFYVATNLSNSNGQDTGDNIHLSQYSLGSVASTSEIPTTIANFEAGYSSASRMINLKYNSLIVGEVFGNLLDMSGKSVMTDKLNTSSIGMNKDGIRVPDHIKSGMYVLHFFVDNNVVSKKIMIQ